MSFGKHLILCSNALAVALALVLPAAPHATAAEAAAASKTGVVDVPLPTLLAPMVVDARLESYAYITIVLSPSSPNQILVVREKMPFLQDAFLRELNKAPIVKTDDPKSVDEDAVKARLVTRMNQILPSGTVSALKLEPIVITPVQPQS